MLSNSGNQVRWENSAVQIRAELIPRYLYTTASIDVFVDNDCILRTGGVLRLSGVQSADFMHGGKSHRAELPWRSGKSFLWYELKIDGQSVLEGAVRPRNAWAALIPATLTAPLVFVLIHFLRK